MAHTSAAISADIPGLPTSFGTSEPTRGRPSLLVKALPLNATSMLAGASVSSVAAR
jgi:hypothetical protein